MQLKPDDRPPHVIALLTKNLSAYKEYEWLETITTEMIEGASLMKTHSEAMGILRDTLALSAISDEFFEAQLAVRSMYHCFCEHASLPMVVSGLCMFCNAATVPSAYVHHQSNRIAIFSSVRPASGVVT